MFVLGFHAERYPKSRRTGTTILLSDLDLQKDADEETDPLYCKEVC